MELNIQSMNNCNENKFEQSKLPNFKQKILANRDKVILLEKNVKFRKVPNSEEFR